MKAVLTNEWESKDAFIIGGGASLKTFNFDWLLNRNVIGVNDAFRLGKPCARAIFGDDGFWKANKWELEEYSKQGGMVYSLAPATARLNLPWIHQLTRGGVGLSSDPAVIGWNHNTGAGALNLALFLGAWRVFLLGFDMTSIQGVTHWHNHRLGPTHQSSFDRFLAGFILIAASLKKFPGREVLNVTDGVSKLEGFPKITISEMNALVNPAEVLA
jgi:hypothetical protein